MPISQMIFVVELETMQTTVWTVEMLFSLSSTVSCATVRWNPTRKRRSKLCFVRFLCIFDHWIIVKVTWPYAWWSSPLANERYSFFASGCVYEHSYHWKGRDYGSEERKWRVVTDQEAANELANCFKDVHQKDEMEPSKKKEDLNSGWLDSCV